MLDAGLVTEDQLERALAEQKRTREPLGAVLVGLKIVDEGTVAAQLALQEGVPFSSLPSGTLEPALLSVLPEALARKHCVVPLGRRGNALQLAMAHPGDVSALDAVREATGMVLERVVAPASEIQRCIERSYRRKEALDAVFERALSAAWGPEQSSGGPIVELVEQIVTRAIEERATDIHVQPEENLLRIRLRIDGLLQSGPVVPRRLAAQVAARIKVMADLDVSESRLPQDGRIRFALRNRTVDLRVSTFLTQHGENIVLRVLDRNAQPLSLDALGIQPQDLDRLDAILRRPNGVVLVTGPSGSGKTTTLYAALNRINSMEINVMTIEEPIEYELPLVRQSQLNPKAGITYASGLRAILRQDPDVILVGEIRDPETAQLAMRASLTGHLVFSTLHPNSSLGVVPRLVDLGVSPALLSSTLQAVLAQRLCRKLCALCRAEDDTPPPELLSRLRALARRQGRSEIVLYQPRGCSACRYTGYHGRVGLFELLEIGTRQREQLVRGLLGSELMEEHHAGRLPTLYEDGLGKALQGLTSLAELRRTLEPELLQAGTSRHGPIDELEHAKLPVPRADP
jgi:type IV pilus assembly protein PilB